MNKEELIGKLQMVYVGDRNALNELIGYYDGLKQGIEQLQQQNKKYKEVIDKAIEYVSNKKAIINTDAIRIFDLFKIDEQGYIDNLLDILKEVE